MCHAIASYSDQDILYILLTLVKETLKTCPAIWQSTGLPLFFAQVGIFCHHPCQQ